MPTTILHSDTSATASATAATVNHARNDLLSKLRLGWSAAFRLQAEKTERRSNDREMTKRRQWEDLDGNQMTDDPDETAIQRALRLKQLKLDARPKPPRGGRFQRKQAAAKQGSSKARPWTSR